jgi:hypothetical protein
MSFRVDVSCKECGPVQIEPRNATIVNIRDRHRPEENGDYGHFVVSCLCPNCGPAGERHQIFDRIDPGTRKMLRQFGVPVIMFQPTSQGNVPKQMSPLRRWLDDNRSKTWVANRTRYLLDKIDAGDKAARQSLESEIDHDLIKLVKESRKKKCTWAPNVEEIRDAKANVPPNARYQRRNGFNAHEVAVSVPYDIQTFPDLGMRLKFSNN